MVDVEAERVLHVADAEPHGRGAVLAAPVGQLSARLAAARIALRELQHTHARTRQDEGSASRRADGRTRATWSTKAGMPLGVDDTMLLSTVAPPTANLYSRSAEDVSLLTRSRSSWAPSRSSSRLGTAGCLHQSARRRTGRKRTVTYWVGRAGLRAGVVEARHCVRVAEDEPVLNTLARARARA